MAKVDIGKTVRYKTLENSLIKAAEDSGWEVRVENHFEERYRLDLAHTVSKYIWTEFNLRGTLLPKMQVIVNGKESTNNFFFYKGFASSSDIENYLSLVSGHLEYLEPLQ